MTAIRSPRLFLVLFLIAAWFLPTKGTEASSAKDQATDVVRSLAAEIWSAPSLNDFDERKDFLAQAIASRTSVDLVSRLSLGRHWRSFDETLRRDYQDLFSRVIIGDLAGRLDLLIGSLDGSLDQHFKIGNVVDAGKRDIVVRSKVIDTSGQTLSVDWRLRDADGGPAIIDLVIEGVSLLVTQRAEFSAVIERSRPEGLIAALRDRAKNENF